MDAKNDKILTAAFRLFHQHGFKKVTMSEIAAAAEMSRPTLYAAFASKEAIFGGLADRQHARGDAEIALRLPRAKTLASRLGVLFDVWILEPFASVIDSPNGLDLLANGETYAPEAIRATYRRFEEHLLAVLAPHMTGRRALRAADLAHILTMATRGLKATATSLEELQRFTQGLITMAVATAG